MLWCGLSRPTSQRTLLASITLRMGYRTLFATVQIMNARTDDRLLPPMLKEQPSQRTPHDGRVIDPNDWFRERAAHIRATASNQPEVRVATPVRGFADRGSSAA